jgi:hypothetical protein
MDTKQSKSIMDLSIGGIGILIFISALTKVRLLFGLFNFQYFWEQAIVIIYFASAIIALIGLLRLRIWGFISAYTHILVATIFLSISVLPFIFNFLRLDYWTATTILLISNINMLFLVAVLHSIKRTLNRKSQLTI